VLITPTAPDYVWQFQRLLPRGRVWHRAWGWLQAEALLILMPTWVRLHERANNLIADAFPCSTTELLPEWEATLGLPDPCVGTVGSIAQRRNAVCAKFSTRGGQSKDYYLRVAEALGFQVRIIEYTPFYASRQSAGDTCGEAEWAYTWTIISAPTSILYFSADVSFADEFLAYWGNEALECAFNAIKPAHTWLIFNYSLKSSDWDDGFSIWDDGVSIWDEGVIPP
jgi:uncharacterized protein YmfQ (DUF2313 family)